MKTGTSDKGYNIALTNQQNHLRLNEVVMNVSPYMDNNAKYNRNRIGNAIFKHYRKEYEYKKCEHKIDGKTYKVDKNLYDTVPKDNKNGIYESINMGKLMCTINVISYQKRRIHE